LHSFTGGEFKAIRLNEDRIRGTTAYSSIVFHI
jgi:hypothetical protein